MNNYEFWQDYLKKVREEIKNICSNKDKLYIDLHMHSNYSADGKQSIKEILENTKKLGFDCISITDHDTLNAYDEIYNYVKSGLTKPIIIPGIEFSIDNKRYGNQCHILQLFVNPKDEKVCDNVQKNYEASFNRSRLQFKRLSENMAIKDILKKHDIKISYNEYIKYLNDNSLFPEYDTLCFYLIDKFKTINITTFDILDKLEYYNNYDCYKDRKEYKTKRYKKLREKYKQTNNNNYNSRFLLSCLAVREVDDDWWPKPSSGSLSVNSYGQLKIEEINKKYNCYFAHPTEGSLPVVDSIIKTNNNIIGLEMNIRNEYSNIENFNNILKKYNLVKTIGSDSHDSSNELYKNMNFYIINSNDMLRIINYGD